ncbi:hypothetical protein ASA1KI_21200 [Opitutales bacterium ASA1]|uniref:hypothetical protein n=1 Tax=Congregicoccus parvus TaxID=3081749 RepID=UPI002B2BB552|nr:hypothetical protein ASA1KI_21200 [Opitutales bacterium ASA1]
MTPTQKIEEALRRIQRRWYAQRPREFYRDRRALLAALTWPAAQLREQGVPIRLAQYACMLEGLLDGIEKHGIAPFRGAQSDSPTVRQSDPPSFYFPGYLTTCVRSHWRHHWEDYYEQGKRLRGTYERMLAGAGRNARRGGEEDKTVEILAAAHALVARRPAKPQAQKVEPQRAQRGTEGRDQVKAKTEGGGQRAAATESQLSLF